MSRSVQSSSFPLSYIRPTGSSVLFTDEELDEWAKVWSYTLVGYSIGRRPYYEALLASIHKI